MDTLTNLADFAHDLIQEGAQRLIDNPAIIVGIAIAAFGGALLAGFLL